MGAFVPVQSSAVKRLLPRPDGDKLREQGIHSSQDLPSQWPQEESCSALCCSCHCSWASVGALVLQGLRWWRGRSHLSQQQTQEPGGHSRVRTPRTLPDCPTPSWPAHAHCQLPFVPPRCPSAPSPIQPMPAVEPAPTSGRTGPGLCFGGNSHLSLLRWQLSPRCPHPAWPDTGPAAGPRPSTWWPLLPAHTLC